MSKAFNPQGARVCRVIPRVLLGAVCVPVLGFYAWTARPEVRQMGIWTASNPAAYDPARADYNLLVDGFRSGQLNLKRSAPFGLTKLADPTDPVANASYRMESGLHDTSYYKGKLYLYFGVTPALVLFWPYVALSGHYLFHKEAVAFFCSVGFLVSVVLVCAIWRRYFPEVGGWVVATCALALGLADCVPVMLQQPDVWQVAVSCAYAMVMLALACIWRALHDPIRPCWWLAAASFAYGLAVGARPNVLFGAVILLVPVIHTWLTAPERADQRRLAAGRMLLSAVIPISLIGLGLMLYNYLRFASPFEFGQNYQMTGVKQSALPQMFSLKYLWFNFRVYFLQPIHWGRFFPFVEGIKVPPAPTDQLGVYNDVFGILPNIPFAWIALAVPLAWQSRTIGERLALRSFMAAMALLFGISALTICLYAGACGRYLVDFVPVIIIFAVCGVLGLERALATRPKWRVAVRCSWVAILLFSVTADLLMSAKRYAEERFRDGFGQLHVGRTKEAIVYFEEALSINPNDAMTHYYLAKALAQAGRLPEAASHYGQVLWLDPSYPGARDGLLQALQKLKQQAIVPAN
ncbi:MAG TPA: tetratricopeptide repeat protein [Opitutaceae bacterium]|nr:tetratricopeptide repeat protein [Opitutaceae bacterium]